MSKTTFEFLKTNLQFCKSTVATAKLYLPSLTQTKLFCAKTDKLQLFWIKTDNGHISFPFKGITNFEYNRCRFKRLSKGNQKV